VSRIRHRGPTMSGRVSEGLDVAHAVGKSRSGIVGDAGTCSSATSFFIFDFAVHRMAQDHQPLDIRLSRLIGRIGE